MLGSSQEATRDLGHFERFGAPNGGSLGVGTCVWH